MEKFTIEKGLPFPADDFQTPLAHRFPLADMDIGDSFLIPAERWRSNNNLQCNVYPAAKRLGIKVKTKSVEGGVRVWRVA